MTLFGLGGDGRLGVDVELLPALALGVALDADRHGAVAYLFLGPLFIGISLPWRAWTGRTVADEPRTCQCCQRVELERDGPGSWVLTADEVWLCLACAAALRAEEARP